MEAIDLALQHGDGFGVQRCSQGFFAQQFKGCSHGAEWRTQVVIELREEGLLPAPPGKCRSIVWQLWILMCHGA